MNRKRSSYGLKQDAERMSVDYVANGMIIAAALAMGLYRTHPFRFTQRPFQHLFETNLGQRRQGSSVHRRGRN